MTSTEQLQNLAAIRKLKTEPPDVREFNGLLLAAKRMLPDAELEQLSPHSRFQLAYDAAHSLALAALRWHGYRASDRYIVFQTLPHTLNFPQGKWRLLDNCHQKRNVALYEGAFQEDERLISELIGVTKDLLVEVEKLPPISSTF
ncbi:MAG: hypothetical protein IPL58_08175 [Betaproteobacteria bacterium]|uniref:SAV-6107-like HEPN domain-containing protein n=1 Tax=Candidatus Proximibacter danicus TaxID=2954365 RepID=A0A9D7PSR2_9PROT|nr:hypothetical protein [Candidatus Proximibacter danicus]